MMFPRGMTVPLLDDHQRQIGNLTRGQDGAIYGEFVGHFAVRGVVASFRIDYGEVYEVRDAILRHVIDEAHRLGYRT